MWPLPGRQSGGRGLTGRSIAQTSLTQVPYRWFRSSLAGEWERPPLRRDAFGTRQILGRGDLDVVRFAVDDGHVSTSPLDNRCGVGAEESLAGGLVVRFEQPGRLEGLRRLHRPEVWRVSSDPSVSHQRGGSPHRESRDKADCMGDAGNQPLNQGGAGKGSDGVMDEHGVDFAGVDAGRERAQARKFGAMALVATGHHRGELPKAGPEWLASCEIRLTSDQHDLTNERDGLEERKRVLEDRSPLDLHEDLVDASPHTRPLPSGHDDGGGRHRAGNTRTRTCAASQNPIMSVIAVSAPATRVMASTSVSRSKTQGPITWTSVSRGTVRRTLPAATSFTVSLMGMATTPTASPTRPSPREGA